MSRKLTALAQLIDMLAKHEGITSTGQLVERTGYSERAIWKAKAELRTPEPECTMHQGSVNQGAQPLNQSAVHPEPECTLNKRASRAHKESPSGIDSTKKIQDSPLAPQGGVAKAQKRGSRLDADWQLPADWRTWARTNFPAVGDEQITEQAATFRDYWIAKPGAQACKLDWEATWRNWCRKGLVLGSIRQPQHTGSFRPIVTTAEDFRAAFARAGVN